MSKVLSLVRALVALVAVVLCGAVPAFATSNSIVISQVYGAGGNTGAVLNQDYVELFNLGSTPVSLNGWSLQYRSSTGTAAVDPSREVAVLPNVTMQPGEFLTFAVSLAGASGTAVKFDYDLATPAGSVPLNLAAGAGQVILSNSTTGTPAGCDTDPHIIDLVGYGAAATCFEGKGPEATTLSATLAAFRKAVCTDTDNNVADFTTGAPAPRNATTAFQPCANVVTTLSVSASADPGTVAIGGTTLLTARVTPLAGSTNVAVEVDLSAAGGSSTQPLYDDGTHGDTTAGDNVFNFNATIAGNPTGSLTLTFTATDAQAHSATVTATLALVQSNALTPIHQIQAGAPNSAYLGRSVTVSGIVTAIVGSGFYLEARDIDQDADPATSEAIFVVAGTSPTRTVGDELQVTGTVQTGGSSLAYATEIGGTVVTNRITTGNPLPTPIALKLSDDSPAGGRQQFLRFQSMRFLIPSFITTAPTGGTLTENTETVLSNGEFYGVVAGLPRPFIEPGISILESSLPSGPTYCTATVTTACVPRFDSNPENFLVESTTLGGAPLDVTSNQTIANLLGIVDFTTSNGARLLLDKAAPGTLGAPMTYIPVPDAAANEFTVGSMNIERFYSTTPAPGAVTLTGEAYARRLSKVSLLLRNVQKMPDIVGLQEVGTLATLNDIAAKISSDALAAKQPDPKYATCLITGNDSTGINTAFLVKTTRVTVVDCSQFGKSTTFTNSIGAQATLNDRPPLVLHAVVTVAGLPAYPVTVISNHLKSLIGVDDTTSTGATVRLKKENQDEFLAALIQGYQAKGEHVVSVGDYNSFFVNDGYVDNLGIVTGNPPAAGTVVVGPTAAYVAPSPKLIDLESTVADPLQRYDYSYIGNAQTLDHIVVTPDLLAGAHIAYSHEDADFPLIQYNDATTPQSTSDHDGAVAFFPLLLPGQTSSASLTPSMQDFGSVPVAAISTSRSFILSNTGSASLNITSVKSSGDFAQTSTCPAVLAASATCTVNVTFMPTAAGVRAGTLIVSASGITVSSALSGTGIIIQAADFSLTPATLSGSLTAGNSASVNLTLSSLGGYTGTVSLSCTGAPAGSTCTPSTPTLKLAANPTNGTVVPLNVAVLITTSRARSSGLSTISDPGGILTLLALVGAGTLVLRDRRLTKFAGLLSALLILALATSGCGSTAPFASTPPSTYTYTLTATDGTLTHTSTYTLTVQ